MDIGKSLPSSDEVLRALGLHAQRSSTDAFSYLTLFGVGMLVGAGLALLFAPKAGEELRTEISNRAHQLRESVGATAAAVRREAGQTYSSASPTHA